MFSNHLRSRSLTFPKFSEKPWETGMKSHRKALNPVLFHKPGKRSQSGQQNLGSGGPGGEVRFASGVTFTLPFFCRDLKLNNKRKSGTGAVRNCLPVTENPKPKINKPNPKGHELECLECALRRNPGIYPRKAFGFWGLGV